MTLADSGGDGRGCLFPFTTGGLASYRCGNATGFHWRPKQGFLFRTRTGTPFLQSNFLRSSLHAILEELGVEKQGFHGFRRFRVTHLESSYVPPALVKYWTGHAKSSDGEVVRQTVTDKYVKMAKDTKVPCGRCGANRTRIRF